MNKLKYVVLFVVVSSVFTFFIVYYNSLNLYEKNGYEIKKSSKSICTSCETVMFLNKKTYYGTYKERNNIQVLKYNGEVINNVSSPTILFKTSDGKGIVFFYKDTEDNNSYVSLFDQKGKISQKSGPYKNIYSDTKTNKNRYYQMTGLDNAQYIVKFDDSGKEVFKAGPYSSIEILKDLSDGVIIKPYDNNTQKYQIIRFNQNGEIIWQVESSYFYSLSTFENEVLYYTQETDGKYIYKYNFDGTKIKSNKLTINNNYKIHKTSDNHYLIANTVDNKKVITLYDENLNVLNHIEGYNYTKITKSIDSDELILLDQTNGVISMVKIDKEGNRLYSKIINTDFIIKHFTKNEVIYKVTVNRVDLHVYLDQDGNKKWETNDIFEGTLNKENDSFNYVVKDVNLNFTFKKIDFTNKEVFKIGPANLITRIAYFDNGDMIYYYKKEGKDQKMVMIVNNEGKTIYEGQFVAEEKVPDKLIIYTDKDEIHVNRNFLY